MDPNEMVVWQHLIGRGFSDVRYEPDGNVPPDFSISGRIAVEARLLGQTFTDQQRIRGLQEVAIPLRQKMVKLLESLGPPLDGESWFVQYRFSRPVEPWKTLEPRLRKALLEFASEAQRAPKVLESTMGFELSALARCSKPFEFMFVLGAYSDHEAGGWVLNEMEKNLKLCIEEKTRKIQKFRSRYSEWWLVLVDRIGYGLDESEQVRFRETLSIHHDWDRIILVNPLDHLRWFQI